MRWRSLVGFGLLTLALLGLTSPTRAGGWAVVTLDALPEEPRAGQTLQLGFMVRQHGVEPVDFVQPYLSASNIDNGESIRVDARNEGPVGHFSVDVTFPSAGTWAWQITPEPFQPTNLGQLAVLPAVAAHVEAPSASVAAVEPTMSRSTLRWIGTFLVLAAAALALTSRRGALGRQGALGPR